MARKRYVLLGRTNNRRSKLQSVSSHHRAGHRAVDRIHRGGRADAVERIFVGVASSFGRLADICGGVFSANGNDGSRDTPAVTETSSERPERPASRTRERRASRTDEETRDGEMERYDEFFPTTESASLFDKQRLRGEV